MIASNSLDKLMKFKEYLGQQFHMKNLGKLKYFLGIEVARTEEGIFFSQRKYIMDIIDDMDLREARPACTPVEQNHKIASDQSPLLPDLKLYRRLVGRLVYLSMTRPEVTLFIFYLSL